MDCFLCGNNYDFQITNSLYKNTWKLKTYCIDQNKCILKQIKKLEDEKKYIERKIELLNEKLEIKN